METVYLICAVAGGTILVAQTVLAALGGGHHDGGHDALPDVSDPGSIADAHDAFLKLLSLKTVVAFVTFFGLAGLACRRAALSDATALGIALGAGVLALWIVAWLMAALTKLQSRGNVDLRNAIGSQGKVYVRVPGARTGAGKVLLTVQGRTVEARAVTDGPEIEAGAQVTVTGAAGNTLEVQRC
ncbi:MAG TPA: NfeD family protein [Planctomycetota bacterium]|nr:NfeD family protein [Planctomycetota bacterium]